MLTVPNDASEVYKNYAQWLNVKTNNVPFTIGDIIKHKNNNNYYMISGFSLVADKLYISLLPTISDKDLRVNKSKLAKSMPIQEVSSFELVKLPLTELEGFRDFVEMSRDTYHRIGVEDFAQEYSEICNRYGMTLQYVLQTCKECLVFLEMFKYNNSIKNSIKVDTDDGDYIDDEDVDIDDGDDYDYRPK